MSDGELLRRIGMLVRRFNRWCRNPAYGQLLDHVRQSDPDDTDPVRAWYLVHQIGSLLEGAGGPLTWGQRNYLYRLRRKWRTRADISHLLRTKLKALAAKKSKRGSRR